MNSFIKKMSDKAKEKEIEKAKEKEIEYSKKNGCAMDRGYSSHDCCSYYQCPFCLHNFHGWNVFTNEINKQGSKNYCPKCKVPLKM